MRWVVALGCLLLDLLIIVLAFYARTSLPLVSPWDVLPIWIFGVFGLSTALLAYGASKIPRTLQTACLMVHGFTAWGIAAAVYRLGFGFDPFIHQAAEQHLVNHGTISLNTPLYLGQYALVWLTHTITQISVIRIDQWLVPILSLLLIPVLERRQRLLPIALFLLPVSWFSFTIPFHLGLLLFLCALFLSRDSERRKTQIALGACAIGSLLIHPLIGIPCSVLVIATLLQRTRLKQHASLLLAAGTPLGLLAGMGVYAATQHATLSLPSTAQIQTSLVTLFGTTYQLSASHIGLSLVYGFLSLWLFTFCLIGIRENLKTNDAWSKLRLNGAIGLCVTAILLACFIRLPDIIAHEQFEFPLRLLHIIPFLFLPDIAQALEHLLNHTKKHRRLTTALTCVVVGFIATTQWFISYPQHNPIAHAYAPGMSQYEYAALDWIGTQTNNKPFIVLSHQMLAAAALQTRGFEQTITTCHGTHLRYAIPTGGALYQDFLTLLRTRKPEEVIQKLKTCYKQAQIVVVVPNYWDPNQRIKQTLTPLSKGTHALGDFLHGYILN